jgi:PIN domain nuclease of toxin-antitoxin system
MRLLLDTHLLLWTVIQPDRVALPVRRMIEDPSNDIHFSVVSIWEVAIKRSLGRADFTVDSQVLRRSLLDSRYEEVVVEGAHAVAVEMLPLLHKDPFDRMLVAQATVEGIMLLTSDASLARYPGPIQKV